jgi:AraC-like DNA-binding protein
MYENPNRCLGEMEPSAAEVRTTIPEGYAEHPPPADLAPLVECFWTRTNGATPSKAMPPVYRVLPDGCSDIVLAYGGRGEVRNGDVDGLVAVGTMTRPLLFAGRNTQLYAGARFRPGCAFEALGTPAEVLTDQQVPLGDVVRDGALDVERVLDQRSDAGRLHALIALVRRRLAGAAPPPRSLRRAVRRILLAGGNLRIEALAAEIGFSRQHLAREFARHAGITPKTFARVTRVRAAIQRAEAARDPDWSEIAYELGYYDQPHFIDDFKSVVGLTPGEWSAEARR